MSISRIYIFAALINFIWHLFIINKTYATGAGAAATHTDPLWSIQLGDPGMSSKWTAYDTVTRTRLDTAINPPGSIKELCYVAGNGKTYKIDLLAGPGVWNQQHVSKFTHWYNDLPVKINQFLQVQVDDYEIQRPIRRIATIDQTTGQENGYNWQIWDYTVPSGTTDNWLRGKDTTPGALPDATLGKWSDISQKKWQPPTWGQGGVDYHLQLHDRLEYIYKMKLSHICAGQWVGTNLIHYNIELVDRNTIKLYENGNAHMQFDTQSCNNHEILGRQWSSEHDNRMRPICKIKHQITSSTTFTGANANQIQFIKTGNHPTIKEYNVLMSPEKKQSWGSQPTYSFNRDIATSKIIDYFQYTVHNGDSTVINDDLKNPKYFWHGTNQLLNPIQNLKLDNDKGPYLWTVIMTQFSKTLHWAFSYTNALQVSEKDLNSGKHNAGFIAVVKSTSPSSKCKVEFSNTIGAVLHASDAKVYARSGYSAAPYNLVNLGVHYPGGQNGLPTLHPDAYIFPALAQKKCQLIIDTIFYLKPVIAITPAHAYADPAHGVGTTKGHVQPDAAPKRYTHRGAYTPPDYRDTGDSDVDDRFPGGRRGSSDKDDRRRLRSLME